MDVRVSVRGLSADTGLRTYAAEKISDALRRFADRITTAQLWLEDLTGAANPGHDNRCLIDVHLRRGGEVVVRQESDDVLACLGRGIERAKIAVSKQLARRKRGIGAG